MTQAIRTSARLAAPNFRAPLHLVDNNPTTAGVRRSAGSGIAWTRAYQSKLRITDIAIILAATAVGYVARLPFLSPHELSTSLAWTGWPAAEFIAVLWIVTMAVFHTRDHRLVGAGADEYKKVIAASLVTFGVTAMVFVVLNDYVARWYFIVAFPLGVTMLVASRWLWRRWLTRQRQFGNYLSRVIVVGHKDNVEYVVARIREKLGNAFAVVGVVLDGGSKATPLSFATHVSRDIDAVADTAAALDADAVIVAGQPNTGGDFIRKLAWQLEGTAAELILASQLTDIAGPRIHFRPVEGLPLIHVEIPQFEGGKHAIKRAMDIVVSAMAILVLLPMFGILALIVQFDSPGGVIFSQKRVGLNGREFRMFKLRSMVSSASKQQVALTALNEGAGPLFKMKNDPRVTRVGRLLRKFSLDELPQLWNVLVGDMSLVGPRPPLPEETREYKGSVHRRLYIKPGLTGMWQINGRSDLSWDDSVRLDLYYVENWSLIGDVVIMWRTLRVLIHPVGAY